MCIAKHEFEAWFLAAAASLAGVRSLPSPLVPPDDPEGIRDAKGWFESRMNPPYSPTVDQPSLAARMDLEQALRCRSFAKFHREVDRVLRDPMPKDDDDAEHA